MSALAGIRVLDLTRYIPGPWCTMLLGDLGADVVKIEEPFVGDPTRAVPPPVGDDSAVHAALNRNKRSVAVDLRSPAGVDVVGRLAAHSDVLVEAFRPGVMERRGLGARSLLGANPRLVYCSISGWGQALCEGLGLPELVRAQWDEKGQAELIEALGRRFATRDRDDWVGQLAALDTCVEPVLDLDEALAQPHAARALIEQDLGGARLRTAWGAVRLSDTPAASRTPAPGLGQHTYEVLSGAGYSAQEIERLRGAGAVA